MGVRKLKVNLLQKFNLRIGRDRLFELLRKTGRLVFPKKSFKKTTYSKHRYAVAINVLKNTQISKPKQAVVCDITYLRLLGGKFAYLYLVTDLFSRKIVGFHVSKDLTHYSALIAIDNAVREHFVDKPEGLIHHSDRGCQYCCHEYMKYLRQHGIIPSMTDESHCYQNAVAERVNGILKDEFNLDQVFKSFQDLKTQVGRAINIYNSKRLHWSLDLQTPDNVFRLAA